MTVNSYMSLTEKALQSMNHKTWDFCNASLCLHTHYFMWSSPYLVRWTGHVLIFQSIFSTPMNGPQRMKRYFAQEFENGLTGEENDVEASYHWMAMYQKLKETWVKGCSFSHL